MGRSRCRHLRRWLVVFVGLAVVALLAAAPPVGATSSGVAAAPGQVWTWGDNSYGELGNGTTQNSTSPIRGPGISNAVAVAMGNYYTVAARADGTVWSWGYNSYGQLGNGTTTRSYSPVQVSGLTGVVAVAAGEFDTYALRSDGTVWDWGYNGGGQLGTGSVYSDSTMPVQVAGLSNVTAIAAGGYFSVALRSDGSVWTWGTNANDELGNGNPTMGYTATPGQISVCNGAPATAIAAGNNHGLAVCQDGTVWAWGYNVSGQLGPGGTEGTDSPSPIQVTGMSNVTAVAAGQGQSLALKSDGTVWAWGYNAYGQLGNGTTNGGPTPTQVSGLTNVTAIGSGLVDSYAIKSDGTVWGWGYNYDGEVGNGGPVGTVNSPAQLTTLRSGGGAIGTGPTAYHAVLVGRPNMATTPTSFAFAPAPVGSTSAAQPITVTNTGASPLTVSSASTAGSGPDADQFKISADGCSGQTVVGGATCTIEVRFAPSVAGPARAQLRISSSVSGTYTLVGLSGGALPGGTAGLSFGTVPGTAFGAGSDSWGQLGNGSTGNQLSPVALTPSSPAFVSLAAGGTHSLGLAPDGTVWAWGYNANGQLGNGSTVASTTPQQVPAPAGMVAVAAGYGFSIALRSDGTVWGWGSNLSGQLGTTTPNSNSFMPVQASGISNVVAIAVGHTHTLALRSDGTVWAWGDNGSKQLGPGTSAGLSSTPVQISSLSGIVAIAAGQYFNLALRSDGSVWGWGDNSEGQLGPAAAAGNNATPVQVTGLTSVVALAAGQNHSLALRSDGTVWAWGGDANGQLGNSATSPVTNPTPAQVPGLSGAVAIAAGQRHSLALLSDGSVWGWGSNSSGQLGTGTTSSAVTTVTRMVALNHGGAALGAGPNANHTLIIGQPYASLSPGTLNFPAQPVGSPSNSLSETVTNNGVIPLHFGQASIIGSDGDEFTFSGDGCSGTTLAPGASCSIGIRFDPKVSGTPAASLKIPSSSPTSPDVAVLDPPPYTLSSAAPAIAPEPTMHRNPVSCQVRKVTRRTVHLGCAQTGHGTQVLKLRLIRRGRTVLRRTVTLRRGHAIFTLRLPTHVPRGRYTVVAASLKQTVRLS